MVLNMMAGYVYVLLFDNDVIKIGRTCAPETRIRSHRNTASKDGVSVSKTWLSPPHYNHKENESRLIEYVSENTINNSREWCIGVDYEKCIQLAGEFVYSLENMMYIDDGPVPLIDYINAKYNGNTAAFARDVGTSHTQATRWLQMGCLWIDGQVWKRQSQFKR